MALVLLRLSIGWHFFYQGMWKLQNPHFSSEPFLRQAKGPWAEHFYALIPDYEGHERLDADTMAQRWQAYYQQWVEYYGANKEQQAAGEALLKGRIRQLKQFLAEHEDEIRKYFNEIERLHKLQEEQPVGDTAFQRKRLWDLRKRLEAQAAPWLAEVDQMTQSLENDLWDLLDDDQKARGRLPIDTSSLDQVDRLVTASNLVIGGCLILGLFTRLASWAGAAFLLSIVMSQPELPWVYPPAPPSAGRALLVNKEFVEMMSLVVLGTTPVGRWGGLDFFVHHLLKRLRTGRRDTP